MFFRIERRSFSYTTSKSLRRDISVPLRERMKFAPLTSSSARPNNRKMIILILFLLFITGFMIYNGFRSPSGAEVKVHENEIGKINAE